MEEEVNNQLPFLDVQVTKLADGKISTTVHYASTPVPKQPPSETPKLFYNYIRQCTRNKDPIPLLKTDEGVELCKDEEKAEHLSELFQSVFTREANLTADNCSAEEIPTIDSVVITEPIGLQELLKLDETKSPGPDVIPAKLLKELAVKLAKPFCLLFQASLAAGRLPPDWKTAWISPIHKSGSWASANNYRPWSDFTAAELMNFLRILEKEEAEYRNAIYFQYGLVRQQIERRMAALSAQNRILAKHPSHSVTVCPTLLVSPEDSAQQLATSPAASLLVGHPGFLQFPQPFLYNVMTPEKGCFGGILPKVYLGFVLSVLLRQYVADVGIIVIKPVLLLTACASEDFEGGGMIDTGLSSHDVVPDDKGNPSVASLCLRLAAPEEDEAGTHLLQLTLIRESGLAERSNAHLVARQFPSDYRRPPFWSLALRVV
ncbi:unnamed protein product [Schistocephalus solidus]|uniref:SARAH domain-containing protein n=1 Tax=Schistocephalus solidus TaxID=70667 RepID=A0A183SUJ4_SCHSO|nr:unnamed protein product [Schistocephalus solidus]